MTRIDGHSKRTTTLADRRKAKNHKPLEAGQTLSQPTGDPKLKQQSIITAQPQTPAVTSPIQASTENIELLNEQSKQQQALDKQNNEIDKTKRRIENDTKKLAQAKNTKEQNQIIERITGNKQKLTKLYNERADIETQLEKTKNTIVKAAEPAPAGDPLGMKKQTNLAPREQFDKVWKENITPNMEKAAAQAERNPLTQAVLQNNGVAQNRNFIAEANKVATTPKAPKTILGNIEIPTVERAASVSEPLIIPEANTNTSSIFDWVVEDEPKRVKTAEQRQEQLQRIRSNPEARARYNRLKLRNNPELKARYESFSKVAGKSSKGFLGKIFKSKAGKVGIGLTIFAGAAYGLSKLFGGSDDKKVETTPEVNPENKPAAPADTTATQTEEPVAETEVKQPEKETPAPVVTPTLVAKDEPTDKADKTEETDKTDETNAVVAKPETEESEKTDETDEAKEAEEAKEADQTEQEINEWIALNGDNYWKYAKRELIFEHQGQADYKPTNKEIAERMAKIMERNGVKFANDGVHSDPMLKIGDKVKVLFKEEEKAA